jgi:antitoxin (DNA-binding transcriptional repressor) of toxin-antitoxin stability system
MPAEWKMPSCALLAFRLTGGLIVSRSRIGYTNPGGFMRQVSLREFRIRSAKALAAVPQGETILLSGQDGPAYFLVPVLGDLAAQDRELRRAMAKASLREDWRRASASGADKISDAAIDHEMDAVRSAAKPPKRA